MGAIHMMRHVVMLASPECNRTFDYLSLSCGWSIFTLLLRLLLTATSAARRKFSTSFDSLSCRLPLASCPFLSGGLFLPSSTSGSLASGGVICINNTRLPHHLVGYTASLF